MGHSFRHICSDCGEQTTHYWTAGQGLKNLRVLLDYNMILVIAFGLT